VQANAAGVEIWHAGVDAREGTLTLYAPSGLGQSITSSFGTESGEAITVRTVTFGHISASLSTDAKVVCKVDIEGHEYRIIDEIVAFARRHAAPVHISLHPRAYFTDRRRSGSAVAARMQTWRATRDIVRKLSSLGPLTLTSTGAPFSWKTLLKLIFLRTRTKNFSLEVRPESRPGGLVA
jgi:hypothetical protein